jgi:diguanylate cyclase (GGDEF)-like protein
VKTSLTPRSFLGLAVENVYLRKTVRFLTEKVKTLSKLVKTDQLTGILNRFGLEDEFDRMLSGALRYGRHLTIAEFDIDHFKTVNDTYGHLAGDVVLKRVAQIIKSNLRNTDIVARSGGEEFFVFLDETPYQDAPIPLERIRQKIAAEKFSIGGRVFSVTISGGYAAYTPDVKPNFLSPEAKSGLQKLLYEKADSALYEAKNSGRDRIRGRQ